jgi:predicted ribosomally synthesized peptide with SipW-like signal peptide
MKSNLKRNVLVSVLTICLLLLLLTGSTYALFTDSASANIVVGSAKVDVEVEITDVKTYSLDVLQASGQFELGGTANVDSTTGELALVHVAPGDKVEFTLDIENNSNITILERVRFVNTTSVNPLLTNLVITIAGTEYKFDANGNFVTTDGKEVSWDKITVGAQKDVVITVELPKEAGNDCQEKSVTLQVILEAYQGNATADDLKNPAQPRV